VRAWRSFDRFDERRASMRTWLYRIATNACLTALERRGRRPLPSGLAAPSTGLTDPLDPAPDQPWLQPFPDLLWMTAETDPAEVVATRSGLRLALVAALQHLPARQRAVLILRDVLSWPAGQVADVLGTSTTAVNSALQRARAHLVDLAPSQDHTTEPADPQHRALLDRYVAAFEHADMALLTTLLREDIELEMPPFRTWFRGRDAVVAFLASRLAGSAAWRMHPTQANGQPAFATYLPDRFGGRRGHSIQVLTITAAHVSRIVAFQDHSLFDTFGLPTRVRGCCRIG
jgi:RNA polymerase sigma-70 factor (ECF subfamily)